MASDFSELKLGDRGSCRQQISLPNDHTACGLPCLRTSHPVAVAHDDDASKGRERLGLVVPDVANQVTDYTSKQRTKEEDAEDRGQP